MYDYIIEEGSDPLFLFETDGGLTYYVAFRKMGTESYPLDNLYSLDFNEIDNKKGRNDAKISSTILTIITDFLDENNHIVLHYICDSLDLKHPFRRRLFSRWFSLKNPPNWIKYDISLEGSEDYTLTFLYDTTIYNSDLIEPEIILTIDSIQQEKQ
ncbi:DUF6169 family protein [Gramella sp. KN1008]|uniref:DUF6169 family protein n=1 Tax=Gramella sp. KN1008 TaxID=2529298 RepID=UPI00103AD817|nr:DUF6169 family protein [Gramella sp. KN1008]TBW27176.1 hypothetical protein EZJ28_12800 [Gramella sp. KN1008]